MYKVEIFNGESMYELEKEINDFLCGKKLIGTSISTYWAGYTLCHTVCVSYKDLKS